MGQALSIAPDLGNWDDVADPDAEKTFLGDYSRRDLEKLFDKFLFPPMAAMFPRDGFIFAIDTEDPFVHEVAISHRLLEHKPPDAQVRPGGSFGCSLLTIPASSS
jgi:hypothetical protein